MYLSYSTYRTRQQNSDDYHPYEYTHLPKIISDGSEAVPVKKLEETAALSLGGTVVVDCANSKRVFGLHWSV